MKRNHLSFWEIDSDQSFRQLAQSLQSKFIDGFIRVFPPTGTGTIKKLKLEDGLHIRSWDLQLAEATVFNKIEGPGGPKEKTFHIAYILNPESFVFQRSNSPKTIKLPTGMNILFLSDDAALDFELPAGHHFQVVDLSVTCSWLAHAFEDGIESMGSFIRQVNEKTHPTIFLDSCPAEEYRVMADLHEVCLRQSKGFLHIKAEVLSLLSDFFVRVLTHATHQTPQGRVLDHEKMLAVEKILQEHMDGTLPCIETIASRMAMSGSTLKRHFKLMFGKNIYRYYLEMKMDFAKKVLLEKPMRVNEVAAMLNYDKVSNFIKMFKKRHGFSPGSLLKSNDPLNAYTA